MQLDLGFGCEEKPEPSEPRIFSVSELTRAVRSALEASIGEVWVRGEVSNHRRQSSGHHYFTLKDEGCQLACVLFAGNARTLRGLRLADGMQVQVFGELTVYEARGQYQLVARLVQEEGLGALQAKFEALKARLAAEGLFDSDRKKPLPRLPRRIGVVTSPTGAAIRDFLKVLHRRLAGVEVVVNPVRVQGRGAAAEIAGAIAEFSSAPESGVPVVDVVVVTRGGGSLEDLWEFNEEAVARAIAASRVPVVSAVGHEIDFSLADFAADLRAPTPSAAAELLVPDGAELLRFVRERAERMFRECASRLRLFRARMESVERSALHREPVRLHREFSQRLDLLVSAASDAAGEGIRARSETLRHARVVLAARSPQNAIRLAADRVSGATGQLHETVAREFRKRNEALAAKLGLLRTLSPEGTLARGYSISTDGAGRVIRSIRDVNPGDRMVTRVADGSIESDVREVRDR